MVCSLSIHCQLLVYWLHFTSVTSRLITIVSQHSLVSPSVTGVTTNESRTFGDTISLVHCQFTASSLPVTGLLVTLYYNTSLTSNESRSFHNTLSSHRQLLVSRRVNHAPLETLSHLFTVSSLLVTGLLVTFYYSTSVTSK